MTFNVISYPKQSFYFCGVTKNKEMINTKLLLLEYSTRDTNGPGDRLTAIQSLRGIISEIDFTSEVVPIDEPERLIKLLTSLKGEQLTGHEIDIVYNISNN